jgi:hypothetical protein
LSLIGFTAFTLVSAMKGLSGETSCGCFGTVTVNPWITAVLDLLIVICLIVFRERLDWKFPTLDHKRVQAVLVAWTIIAGLALFAMLSLDWQPHATLGKESIGLDGRKLIMLEPERWINKEFPLVSRFAQQEGAEMLMAGTWTVLLIHSDCPRCLKMMADWKDQNAKGIAIVIVPSRRNEKAPDTPFPVFWLDQQNGWYAMTPCVVKLSEGICVTVGEQVFE